MSGTMSGEQRTVDNQPIEDNELDSISGLLWVFFGGCAGMAIAAVLVGTSPEAGGIGFGFDISLFLRGTGGWIVFLLGMYSVSYVFNSGSFDNLSRRASRMIGATIGFCTTFALIVIFVDSISLPFRFGLGAVLGVVSAVFAYYLFIKEGV